MERFYKVSLYILSIVGITLLTYLIGTTYVRCDGVIPGRDIFFEKVTPSLWVINKINLILAATSLNVVATIVMVWRPKTVSRDIARWGAILIVAASAAATVTTAYRIGVPEYIQDMTWKLSALLYLRLSASACFVYIWYSLISRSKEETTSSLWSFEFLPCGVASPWMVKAGYEAVASMVLLKGEAVIGMASALKSESEEHFLDLMIFSEIPPSELLETFNFCLTLYEEKPNKVYTTTISSNLINILADAGYEETNENILNVSGVGTVYVFKFKDESQTD